MRSPFSRLVKRTVRAGSNMVSQVVVSVAAAVCVGFITNAYLERTSSPAEPASTAAIQSTPEPAAAEPAPRAMLSMSEDVTGDTDRTGQPARPVQTPNEPVIRNIVEAPLSISAEPVADASTPLPPLDSQVVSDLPVSDITPVGAEIFPGVPAEGALTESLRDTPDTTQKPERRHFLGLPIPNFVPSPNQFVESASAAGSKIVSVVEGR